MLYQHSASTYTSTFDSWWGMYLHVRYGYTNKQTILKGHNPGETVQKLSVSLDFFLN